MSTEKKDKNSQNSTESNSISSEELTLVVNRLKAALAKISMPAAAHEDVQNVVSVFFPQKQTNSKPK